MNSQRMNILMTAKKLFYEKGYYKTQLSEIADICQITKPLISYHFKSKSALAREVRENYTHENKNKIALKLYNEYFKRKGYDLQISTSIEIRLDDYQFMEDQNVKRFIIEFADAKYEDMFDKSYYAFYEIHDRRYHLDINRNIDEMKMIARGAIGSTLSIKLAYVNNEINCTQEECLDYLNRLQFKFMKTDEKRIDEIILESKKIIKNVGFELGPYFQIF